MDTKKYIDENGNECSDLLLSNKILKEFHDLVTLSTYPVYALSGGWGTGKTTFIKMWQAMLDSEEKPYIYIDAFRMDYETEPFLMLLSAFKDFINKDKSIKKELLDKYKKIFTLKSLTKLGFSVFLEKVGGTSLKDFIDETLENCFDVMSEEKSLYHELSKSLENIVNQPDNLPFHIIVDELDRCRPDYALETLERIKHIFNIKNVKFILVYNEDVLKSMIKTKYGIDADTERYLHKFVQKTYILDNTKHLETWYMSEIESENETFSSNDMLNVLKSNSKGFLAIREKYSLSLRDMQQLFSNLKNFKYRSKKLNPFISYISLEILKFIDRTEYAAIQRDFRMKISDNSEEIISLNPKFLEVFNIFRQENSSYVTEFTNEDLITVLRFYYSRH